MVGQYELEGFILSELILDAVEFRSPFENRRPPTPKAGECAQTGRKRIREAGPIRPAAPEMMVTLGDYFARVYLPFAEKQIVVRHGPQPRDYVGEAFCIPCAYYPQAVSVRALESLDAVPCPSCALESAKPQTMQLQ
jgi:hypothetical protein